NESFHQAIEIGGVFANARPDYKKGNKGMPHIYAEF
ncbi:hypothetical protein LCGC14_1713180, partial [marine sediment metagenome]